MENTDWQSDRTLDAEGLQCPLPVLKARKTLIGMTPGERLAVTATDPMAIIDVPHFCNEAGHRLLADKRIGNVLHFLIERGGKH